MAGFSVWRWEERQKWKSNLGSNGWGSQNYNIMGVAKAALECRSLRRLRSWTEGAFAFTPFAWTAGEPRGFRDFADSSNCCRRRKARPRPAVGVEDVSKAVAFLALDGAKLITGDTIYIDGGYHIID